MTADRKKPDSGPAFYTVAGVANRWECSEKHVRRLIQRKELVAHRFGNALRIGADDLDRYERMNRMV